ncbi:hypothetical protein EFD55_15625 [Rhizobium pisi]|uniref:Uncharacterized protein n=1 Tax=Rhizobium pisi TaxID=574561 RepID=A0A427MYW2_9HYPH|nr:hypothetical protein EFD55_15625 [Rhizobium pisi]
MSEIEEFLHWRTQTCRDLSNSPATFQGFGFARHLKMADISVTPRAGKTHPRPQFIRLDLNYPDGVQIFAMAFAERIPMVPITRRAVPRTRA